MVKQRMRRGEQPRDPAAIVLRGDGLDEEYLNRDAEANFAIYGFYGLSVWVPGANVSEDDILAGKLVKAQTVVRFVAGDLYTRDLRPVPRPGRRPGPMIYIDLDADLNMHDDDGRNLAVIPAGAIRPAAGSVLVAGRARFWSWVVVDTVHEEPSGTALAYFHQVSAKHAASIAPFVTAAGPNVR